MNIRSGLEKFRGHEVPHLDIIDRKRTWFVLSGFFILLSIVGLVARGLNFSIDFKGGSLLKYPCPNCVSGKTTADDVHNALTKFGLGDAEVQVVNANSISVRTRSLTALAGRPATVLTMHAAAISVQDVQTILAEYGRSQADVSSTPTTLRVKTAPLTEPQRGFVMFYDTSKTLTADQIRTEVGSLGYPGASVDVFGTTVVVGFASLPVKPHGPAPPPSPSAGASATPTPSASPSPVAKGRAAVVAALAGQAGIASGTVTVRNLATVTESAVVAAVAQKAGVPASQISKKEITGKEQQNLLSTLAAQAGTTTVQITRQDVGPTWGAQISSKAIKGLIIFLILVSIYIGFRFEWKMAAGAQTALLHDLIITAGIYALVGRTVSPATVIAILTILGYSLYDTVVIFDKVRENTTESSAMLTRDTYSGVVNTSMNQVLMRSVNTSLVVLLPILSLLLFGGATLKDFAFALFVGVASGTYSSIFVASPTLALLKEREPKYRQIRARIVQRATVRPQLRTVTAGDGETTPSPAPPTEGPREAPTAPRPKKRRKTTAAQRRRW